MLDEEIKTPPKSKKFIRYENPINNIGSTKNKDNDINVIENKDNDINVIENGSKNINTEILKENLENLNSIADSFDNLLDNQVTSQIEQNNK